LLKLYQELDIRLDKKEMICFVGAGGKTSAMFHLAKELKQLGKKVLVTTTTSIFFPKKEEYDFPIINPRDDFKDVFVNENGSIIVMGKECTKERKLKGFDKSWLDQLFMNSDFDYILVEGDGSRRKPIKAPASYEPVIPSLTACTIGVVGLDSVGKSISQETVHRVQAFCDIVGQGEGSIIDEESIIRLVSHENGLFKGTPRSSRKYLLLNKADDEETKKISKKIALSSLSDEKSDIEGIIAASVLKDNLYCHWRGKN